MRWGGRRGSWQEARAPMALAAVVARALVRLESEDSPARGIDLGTTGGEQAEQRAVVAVLIQESEQHAPWPLAVDHRQNT